MTQDEIESSLKEFRERRMREYVEDGVEQEQMVTFASGAKRTDIKSRYELIDRVFLAGMADVLTEGLKKYGRNNWKKADIVFAQDAINHVIEHVYKFIEGDRSEDHLLHAACGLMFCDYYNRKHPEWFDFDS